MKKSAGLPRFVKILLVLLLLLLVFICCAPSRRALDASQGLWGARVLWNRVRDYGAIPVSFGIGALLLGSVYLSCVRKQTPHFPKKRQLPALLVCGLLMAVGIYWTVSLIRIVQLAWLPFSVWTYLLEHRVFLCLWWIATGLLLLLPIYGPKAAD